MIYMMVYFEVAVSCLVHLGVSTTPGSAETESEVVSYKETEWELLLAPSQTGQSHT